MEFLLSGWIAFGIFIVVLVKASIKMVPQNTVYLVERMGKYNQTMTAGLNFLIPFIDRVAYKQTLKEVATDVPSQSAITKDNISLGVDGVLYTKIVDPYKASYGVDNYIYAVTQLAQTTMRSEIGKMDLDKTFEERESLNVNIVESINEAAAPWGVQVLRYEIKDLEPPQSVLQAMERQMKAEREKRAAILESEGKRQSAINIAEGEKQARVLAAEADKSEQILSAEGEAASIVAVADARAKALKTIGDVVSTPEGMKAVQMDLANSSIQATAAIAKESSVVLLPESKTDTNSMVAQAMSIINAINASSKKE